MLKDFAPILIHAFGTFFVARLITVRLLDMHPGFAVGAGCAVFVILFLNRRRARLAADRSARS